MGHMFYNNMGASAGGSIFSVTNTTNLALFTNLKSFNYWSGTVYKSPGFAWYFQTYDGLQNDTFQFSEVNAWAVRPGDVVAVQAISEPETYSVLLA